MPVDLTVRLAVKAQNRGFVLYYNQVWCGVDRIAWAGGKITSNKEEAMLAFLRRKQKQGGLNDEQKAILQKLAEEEHGAHKATVQTGSGGTWWLGQSGRQTQGGETGHRVLHTEILIDCGCASCTRFTQLDVTLVRI